MSEGWTAIAIPAVLGAATLGLFAFRRVRADGVAVLALAVAVTLGLVPPAQALAGMADPVVVAVGALAILAGAVHRSGIVELPSRGLGRHFRLTTPVLLACGVLVASLAAVSGRVGTRAAILRATVSTGDRASSMLNAVCLLGGLMTVVGGVPNLLVSTVRRDLIGAEFDVLAFLPVGGAVFGAGTLVFLAASMLARRTGYGEEAALSEGQRRVKSFTSEVLLPGISPMVGRTVAGFEAVEDGALSVVALVREGFRRIEPRPDWVLEAGDLLVLDCEPTVLQRLIERYRLDIPKGWDGSSVDAPGSAVVEAIVTQSSELIGQSPRASDLGHRYHINLLAIGRNDDHPPSRLRRTKLRAGDILMVQGDFDAMPSVLAGLGCLMLAERRLRIGRRQQIALPAVTLLAALGVAAAGLLPLWLALLLGVLLLSLAGVLTLQEAYETCPWPGLIMLASLLPLAAALHGSAAAVGLAGSAAAFAADVWPGLLAASIVLGTMLMTWLFGSAVAVLLVAPFMAAVALHAGLPPDMLLIAVAIGAAVDMLDPAGLVAALVPGTGRRVGRDWRSNLAVAALLLLAGTGALVMVWRT